MTDRVLLQVLPVDEESEDLETTAAAVELTDQARRALAARGGVPGGVRYVMGRGSARIETDVYGFG